MPTAIVRAPSASLADCALSFVARAPIDIERAHAQHADYEDALRELGCELIRLPAEDTLPDAVFVEDLALVFEELAIMTRPGAPSRRLESATVEVILRRHRQIEHIKAPGTLDGGDVLRIGRTLFVGESARSNAPAIEQLAHRLLSRAYSVRSIPTRDCLHLKSAVTEVANGVVLINPDWVDQAAFADQVQILVDPDEPHAANALRIGNRVIYPQNFPRTATRLRAAGIDIRLVDVSELQKAEGAVTCCSLILN